MIFLLELFQLYNLSYLVPLNLIKELLALQNLNVTFSALFNLLCDSLQHLLLHIGLLSQLEVFD